MKGGEGQGREVSTVVIRWNEGGAATPPRGDQRHWRASHAPFTPLFLCRPLRRGKLTDPASRGGGGERLSGGGDPASGWAEGWAATRTERLHPKSQISLRDFCFGELRLVSRLWSATGPLLTGNRRHHGMWCGSGGGVRQRHTGSTWLSKVSPNQIVPLQGDVAGQRSVVEI